MALIRATKHARIANFTVDNSHYLCIYNFRSDLEFVAYIIISLAVIPIEQRTKPTDRRRDNNMAFESVKKTLRYAKRYNCTIDMLYLDDRKSVVNSMEEIDGYDGKVSSCIDIVSELCDKHSATKTAEILHKKYAIDMSHVESRHYVDGIQFCCEGHNRIGKIGMLYKIATL
jgi:hypothetical protein